ncbi:uncharacterized protein A4U43_C07F24300 [Asparagus officinalis]|uniref:Uncharacterized protein n=1 Tax=Asparagus officinalis TaxID=4686 RepID=A0A5P1EEN9_ASPOF|nr:pentatricopeptide repeat-containing protein At3g46790, chloroplastic-like [Asparagus officinalis]ONK64304.1 uncharacterized protein A4U43_C07F24300 [Asparagus officinalis]
MHIYAPLARSLIKSRSPTPPISIVINVTYLSTSSHSKTRHRNSYYFSRIIQSNPSPSSLTKIHTQIITSGHFQNPFLVSKLVSVYSDTGDIKIARKVFDKMPDRDTHLWNVMIRGYANAGPQSEAVCIYNEMRRASVVSNCYTYPFVLKACAAVNDERIGRGIHGHILINGLVSNVFVGNALVAFYAKSGEADVSRKLFDEIIGKDLVSWNSMIAGYAHNNNFNEAIDIFHRMLKEGFIMPDRVTLVAVLPALAALAAIREGIWAHSYAIKKGLGLDIGLASGLIGMYANCGRLETARMLFDRTSERNLVLYNSMLHAYGTHGHASEALEVFSQMLDMGIEPDGICFVCLLSACSHAGLVDKGFEIFEMMTKYEIEKNQIHYACIVDMLGRAGQLNRAFEFIKEMQVEPGRDVWGALLGACRIWNDVVLAEEAAKRLFVLDPENAGRYAILANIFEDVGRVEDAARVRRAMRDRGVRKPLGCSMVEVDMKVHTFGVQDESHPMTDDIFHVLCLLQREVNEDRMELGMT